MHILLSFQVGEKRESNNLSYCRICTVEYLATY